MQVRLTLFHCAAFCLAAILLSTGCNGQAPPRVVSPHPGGPEAARGPVALRLVRVFPAHKFERPVALHQAPGGAAWYVVEQAGRVLRLSGDPSDPAAARFLDIRDRVDDGANEAGLLGLAFHPEYRRNRTLYLSYTRDGLPLQSVISRFTASADGHAADPATERVVLTLDQPYANHNGGQIAFGPDGYLYAGFGDGGAGGDPLGHGQNRRSLLGAMLRIDVNSGAPYSIPPDNPFAAGGGAPEIFAWGLRNPWRWSFDRETGALWVGDVGQNRYEEIDLVRRGGNYGWNIREAAHDFGGGGGSGLIDPVVEYGRGGGCSVTGGYVYRGARIPALRGAYVFGDFCSGLVWGLFRVGGATQIHQLIDSGLSISSFAEGNDGELYVLDLDGGGIYRLAP